MLVQAPALSEWHRAHRFCPRCGGRLVVGGGGYVLRCESCGREQFPRTDPAVIMLVVDGDRALLGRQSSWPEGRYSTLAGFVDPGESLEDAVAREVMEEAGIEVTDVTYFGNQPWPFPSSLMVAFFARAVSKDIDVDDDELEAARWFTRDQMRAEAEAGTLVLPGGISISRSLVEAWYGGGPPRPRGGPGRGGGAGGGAGAGGGGRYGVVEPGSGWSSLGPGGRAWVRVVEPVETTQRGRAQPSESSFAL